MNIYDFTDKLTLLSPVFLLLGIIGGLLHFFSLGRSFQWITVYLIVALLTDLISRILSALNQGNLILLPVFNLLESLIFGIIYLQFFGKSKRYLIVGIVIGSWVCCVQDLLILSVDPDHVMNSYSSMFESLGIMFLAFLFFFEGIRKYQEPNKPVFALNSVILVYFTAKLMFYIPISFFINESSDLKFYFWMIHLVMLIIFYFFLAKSLWTSGRTRK